MTDEKPQGTSINTGLFGSMVDVSSIHLNLSQDIIVTTEDKVRLCLSQHLGRAEKKKGWIAPLGIFITIVVALVTTSFKDAGLDAATWKAIFVTSSVGTFLWLLYSVKGALSSMKLEDIVQELKKASPSGKTSSDRSA